MKTLTMYVKLKIPMIVWKSRLQIRCWELEWTILSYQMLMNKIKTYWNTYFQQLGLWLPSSRPLLRITSMLKIWDSCKRKLLPRPDSKDLFKCCRPSFFDEKGNKASSVKGQEATASWANTALQLACNPKKIFKQ